MKEKTLDLFSVKALSYYRSPFKGKVVNIEVSFENLNAARSRIVDVDYAQETAQFMKSKILSQAGLSVQAQANAMPEMVLGLIR